MIPNKCLGNKPISVHVSNLQHFPLLPLYWLLLICTGIHWLFYGLTHLMNHHTVKSSLWVQESKSKSAGHTPIQPIQQFLHSRINARVWKRAMHNKNNLLLVLKSVALDTMQPDEILGFGLQPHLLVMIGHCKLYVQSHQHFYSIKPYMLKLNLSIDKQFSVPSTSSVFLWLKGGELPQAFPWETIVMSRKVILPLFSMFLISHFETCAQLWGPQHKENVNLFERVQRGAIRVIRGHQCM